MTAALFLHQVIDASSRVVPGASLTFMQGFRKGAIFHDDTLRTPAQNPITTDSAGRVRLYLNAGETYEVTVETPKGERYQFVHVARADGEVITQTVEVVREVIVADPAQAARIAELEAKLSEMHREPVPVEIPEFLNAPTDEVVSVLEDAGVTYTDSYERVNLALATSFTKAKSSAELARSYGGSFDGRSVVEWERKAQAINESIRWNAGRRAEAI